MQAVLANRTRFSASIVFSPCSEGGRLADEALGAGPDVVEDEGHRDAGVKGLDATRFDRG